MSNPAKPDCLINAQEVGRIIGKTADTVTSMVERGVVPWGIVDRPTDRKRVCTIVRSHFEKWLAGEDFPVTNIEFIRRSNTPRYD